MTNTEFYTQMFDGMENYLAKNLGQMMSMAGVPLTEIDPELLKFWNEAVKYLNDCRRTTISWARAQDKLVEDQLESNRKNKIMMQTMVGMIEKQRELLKKQGDQLDRIERKLGKN